MGRWNRIRHLDQREGRAGNWYYCCGGRWDIFGYRYGMGGIWYKRGISRKYRSVCLNCGGWARGNYCGSWVG